MRSFLLSSNCCSQLCHTVSFWWSALFRLVMPTEFQAALWRLLFGISTYCFWYGAIPRQSGRAAEPSVVSSEIGRTWWISVSESPKVYISSFVKMLWMSKTCPCDNSMCCSFVAMLHAFACCMHFQLHQVFAGGFHRFRCLARPSV